MFENLKASKACPYVESVLAVTALSHKEFTVCCYSLSSIIFSLEMGKVEDKSTIQTSDTIIV